MLRDIRATTSKLRASSATADRARATPARYLICPIQPTRVLLAVVDVHVRVEVPTPVQDTKLFV
jgi:hypothetical protein